MSTKRHLGMLLGVNNVHNHNVTHARARNSLPLAHLPASPHSRSHAARPRVVTRRRTHGALYHVEVRAARARLPAPSSLDSRSSRSCRRGCRPQPLSGSNRAEADRTRSSERPPHGSTRGRPVVAHQLSRCRVDSLTSVHARAVHMSMGTTAFDSSDAVVGHVEEDLGPQATRGGCLLASGRCAEDREIIDRRRTRRCISALIASASYEKPLVQ